MTGLRRNKRCLKFIQFTTTQQKQQHSSDKFIKQGQKKTGCFSLLWKKNQCTCEGKDHMPRGITLYITAIMSSSQTKTLNCKIETP